MWAASAFAPTLNLGTSGSLVRGWFTLWFEYPYGAGTEGTA